MGGPQKECMIVCHEDLFLPIFDRLPVLGMASLLPEIRRMIDAGHYDETMDFVVEKALEAGYPADFIMTDPSHPAFDMLLDFGPEDEVSGYQRAIDFSTGEASVCYVTRGVRHLRRSFVSRKDGILVAEILSDKPVSVDICLGTRPFTLESWEAGRTSRGNVPKGQFYQRGIEETTTKVEGNDIVYRCSYARTQGGYEGICRVIYQGGRLVRSGSVLRVLEADSVLLICGAAPLDDYGQSAIPRLLTDFDGLNPDYDILLQRHVTIHSELFGRVSLHLGEEKYRSTPLEEQLMRAREGKPEPKYIEMLFDACRYLIISSTGRLPPNLQGVWSATWTPHWSGDYTLDANVQAAVAHMLACGTPELMLPLFTLMDDFLEDFRENARSLYGAEGIFVNSRVSTTGLQQRYNRCPVYFWTAGGAWIAHYYWEYYLYTEDREFLNNRALPFMRECARFYETFLIEDEGGTYLFSPSWSPENHAANTGSPIAQNATMDIAACKELFANMISASEILGIGDDMVPKYRELIEKLPPYLANEDGALKEWSSPRFDDRYSHRHMSHLYPIYPGREADPDSNPNLYSMVLRAVEKRLEHYDASDYGSFGLYHAAIVAGRCGDAHHAWEALSYLARWHVYSGMGTSHNPGPEIFNVDMAGGFPAAVIELLVGAKLETIRLLPAVPGEWRKGSVHGIRCPGRVILVELGWDLDERRLTLGIRCEKDIKTTLILPDESRNEAILQAGETSQFEFEWERAIQ